MDIGSGATGPGAIASSMTGVGLADRLALASRSVEGRLVFTTSFGLEDQAITHAIFEAGLEV